VSASPWLLAALTLIQVLGLLWLLIVALWWVDRYDGSFLRPVVFIFVWGMSGAIVSRGLLSFGPYQQLAAKVDLHVGHALQSAASGPLLEELWIAAGLILATSLTRKLDCPMDGVLYGSAAGFGFISSAVLLNGNGRLELIPVSSSSVLVAAGGVFLVLGAHLMASIALGGLIGVSRVRSGWRRRGFWIVGGLAVAVASLMVLERLVILLAGLIAIEWLALAMGLATCGLLGLFFLAEHRVLLRELGEEAELGTVPQWVAKIAPFYRKRIRRGWWPAREERTTLSRLFSRLAFRKYALRGVPRDRASLAGLEIVNLRKRLREILAPVKPEEP